MIRRGVRLSHTVFSAGGGKRTRFAFGSVTTFPGPAGSYAVVVSKKVFKGAVERNRLRRRVSHALHGIGRKLPVAVVVHPNREALSAPYQELKLALEAACVSR